MKKRLIALLLAAAMIASMLPVSAFAEEEEMLISEETEMLPEEALPGEDEAIPEETEPEETEEPETVPEETEAEEVPEETAEAPVEDVTEPEETAEEPELDGEEVPMEALAADNDNVTTEAELRELMEQSDSPWVAIRADITLTQDLYVSRKIDICGGRLTVPSGITMTLGNGAVVDLYGQGYLDVQGNLVNKSGSKVRLYAWALNASGLTNLSPDRLTIVHNIETEAQLRDVIQESCPKYNEVLLWIEDTMTLQADLTVPQNAFVLWYGEHAMFKGVDPMVFTIPVGVTMTLNCGSRVDEYTELVIDGTLINNGFMDNEGTITGDVTGNQPNDRGNGGGDSVTTEQELLDMLENSSYAVIAGEITLTKNLTLAENKQIILIQGGKLVVPKGKTLSVDGSIILQGGVLKVNGTYRQPTDLNNSWSGVQFYPGWYQTGKLTEATNLAAGKVMLVNYAEDSGNIEWSFAQKGYRRIFVSPIENITLKNNVTIPANGCLHIMQGDVAVPKGVTLTNNGSIQFDWNQYNMHAFLDVLGCGKLINNNEIQCFGGYIRTMQGTFVNGKAGHVVMWPENMERLFGSVLELKNVPAAVRKYVEVYSPVRDAEELLNLINMAEGLKYVESGLNDQSVTIDSDLVIPKNSTIWLSNGDAVLADGATLTNNGFIIGDNMTLDIRDGKLVNNGTVDSNVKILGVEIEVDAGTASVAGGKTLKIAADYNVKNLYSAKTITLSLAPGDEAYASIKGNVLTAKKVTERHNVRVIAKSSVGVPEKEYEVEIYPIVTNVMATTGSTATVNTRAVDTLTLRAFCMPAQSCQDIEWTSNIKAANGSYVDNGDGTITFTGLKMKGSKAVSFTATAKALDGSGKSTSVKVTLTTAALPGEIRIDGPQELMAGASGTYKAAFAETIVDKNVVWMIRDEDAAYATMKNGKLTAAKNLDKAVTVRVIAASKADENVHETMDVRLTPKTTEVQILLGKHVLPKNVDWDIAENGGVIILKGNTLPADASKAGTWKSSNKKIAEVNDDGVVIYKGNGGKVTITFTAADGSKKSSAVTFNAFFPVLHMDGLEDVTLTVGQKKTVKPVLLPDNAYIKKVTYVSDNPAVAAVNAKGQITAKAPGTATITVKATDPRGYSQSFTVTVLPKVTELRLMVGSGDVTGTTVQLPANETLTVQPFVMPKGASAEVTWKSSAESIVKVDAAGNLIPQKLGKATITATAKDGSKKSAKVNLVITAPNTNPTPTKVYTVGICQLLQHPALDAATKGFSDALTEKLGNNVIFNVQNAMGDFATCSAIANSFVANGCDLIMANATPALLAAVSATNTIPVLGTSVTDYASVLNVTPDANGALGMNVSGTSDSVPAQLYVDCMLELVPDVKNVSIIYCSAEPGSVRQADQFIAAMGSKAACKVYTFTDSNDMKAVVNAAIEGADAVYIPVDNTAASNMVIVSSICEPAGIPVICGEEGMCSGGGLATVSISYYDIGHVCGEMAYDILVNGADVAKMPVGHAANPVKKYNPDYAAAIGFTMPKGYEAIE